MKACEKILGDYIRQTDYVLFNISRIRSTVLTLTQSRLYESREPTSLCLAEAFAYSTALMLLPEIIALIEFQLFLLLTRIYLIFLLPVKCSFYPWERRSECSASTPS